MGLHRTGAATAASMPCPTWSGLQSVAGTPVPAAGRATATYPARHTLRSVYPHPAQDPRTTLLSMTNDTPSTSAFADPAYRVAVIDLLGGLAYSELTAFERLTEDAAKAPTLE